MTILWQEHVSGGGLQVQNKAGQSWVDVPALPDTFVVNLGDSLERWTNDKWVSTMHRVVNPPRDVAATHSRVSIPYFVQPNYHTVIECIDSCFDETPGQVRTGTERGVPLHEVHPAEHSGERRLTWSQWA